MADARARVSFIRSERGTRRRRSPGCRKESPDEQHEALEKPKKPRQSGDHDQCSGDGGRDGVGGRAREAPAARGRACEGRPRGRGVRGCPHGGAGRDHCGTPLGYDTGEDMLWACSRGEGAPDSSTGRNVRVKAHCGRLSRCGLDGCLLQTSGCARMPTVELASSSGLRRSWRRSSER